MSIVTLEDMTYPQFAEALLWIKDKRGRIIPFIRNPIQKKVHSLVAKKQKLGYRYFNVLKYRRGGITTDQQGINFFKALHYGQSVVTLAHEGEDTEKIFGIAKLFYQRLYPGYRPQRSRKIKRELEFPELNSQYYIGTAGSRTFSRGSTLQRFHGSEVAFWPGAGDDIDSLVASLTEAASHGEGVLESTANGVDNWFYTQWKQVEEGKAGWYNIFLPWFEDPDNVILLGSEEEKYEILESLNEEETLLAKKFNLSYEQIKWRRQTKDRLRRLFPQEYPEDSETAFLTSGSSYFNIDIVNELIKKSKKPIKTKWQNQLRIWQLPIPGQEYVVGTDVAAGIDDSKHDFSSSIVIERESGRHVATLKCKLKPHEFTIKTIKMCELYKCKGDMPLWGIERNEHGRAVLADAIHIHEYPHLYKHSRLDPASKQRIAEHGWPTNAKTRPVMIDDLAEAIEEGLIITDDVEFLSQCRNFVLKKGKFEAASGCHDDDVMAAAIAWQMRTARRKIPSITVI